MFLFFLLAAGIGGALTALSLLLPEAGILRATGADEPANAPPPLALTPARLRTVALPLLAVGALGATLHGLDRGDVISVSLALLVGIPTGLAGAWLIQRARASGR